MVEMVDIKSRPQNGVRDVGLGVGRNDGVRSSVRKPPRMIHTLTNSCPQVGLVLAVDFEEWVAGWDTNWKEKYARRVFHPQAPGECQIRAGTPLGDERNILATSFTSSTPASPSEKFLFNREKWAILQAVNIHTLSAPTHSASSVSSVSFSSDNESSRSSPSSSPATSPVTSHIPSFSSSSKPSLPDLPLFTTEFFEVRKSRKIGGGYGAFATKDIGYGTIISSEKSLFRSNFHGVFSELENLTSAQRKEYHALCGWTGNNSHHSLAIFQTNRFEVSGRGLSGIFLKSSRFNHACHPFATCKYKYHDKTDELVVTTCMSVKKGVEITISYDPEPNHLPGNYGFYCDCPGCPSVEAAKAMEAYLAGTSITWRI